MKNIFCSLGFIAALCSGVHPVFCQTVAPAEAEKVAVHFMKTQNPQAQIVASGTEHDETALIYAFNFQPGGFVLVAGDKKSAPILGFSPESHFYMDHLNPEATVFLNTMKSQISFLKDQEHLPSLQVNWEPLLKGDAQNSAESDITVGPYLTTKWNQGQYYNQYCPAAATGPAGHVYTGCVATAMAQLIKFHNSPAYGKGFHQYQHGTYGWQTADFENTKYNWANMPNSLTSSNSDVATLLYQCGVAVDMDYGATSSAAAVSAIAPALQNYFSFSSLMQWTTYFLEQGNFSPKIKADLDLGHPAYMTGCGNLFGDCHAWICDGYKIIPGMPMYYCMNWGWGGSADGYYLLGNFNTGTYSFDWHLTVITGIEPSCPRYLNVNNSTLAGLPLEAIETITASMPVVPYLPFINRINYDAGRYIQMNPGFQATGGTLIFRAYIQGCGGSVPFASDDQEDRSPPVQPVAASEPTATEINIRPNPFVGSTAITYELPAAQVVDIQIYNTVGRLVAQPIRQALQDAGPHEHIFEAGDLPTGIYLLVLQTGGKKLIKRIVLAR